MVSWCRGITVSWLLGITTFFLFGFSIFTGSTFSIGVSAGGGVTGSALGCVGAKKGLSAKPDLLILIEPPLQAPCRHEHRRNWEHAQICACAGNGLLPGLHS